MGLAVDVDKGDGAARWSCPSLRDADTLDFSGFLAAYEELIRKVKANKLTVADFQGATVTLTNPGTIGTVQSVPRLMPGQGVIVGVGASTIPPSSRAPTERALGSFGVSKVVTITSTYDHRIIQGAESGMFLKRVHELLLGEHGFYESVFQSLGVPYEAVKWRPDVNPIDREEAMLHKQMQVATLIRVHRVAATSSPTSTRCGGRSRRCRWSSTRHLWPDHLGPRPRVPDRGCGRRRADDARRPAGRAPRCVLPHHRHRVHAHPEHRRAALDPSRRSRAPQPRSTRRPSGASWSA